MQYRRTTTCCIQAALLLFFIASASLASEGTVTVALNYPETGPYFKQGKEQWKAAYLAKNQINAQGGILNKQVELVTYNTQSNTDIAAKNAVRAIDIDGAQMVFGGSSSAVAVAVSKVCQQKGVPFFGTLTYSTTVTGCEAHRHTFRECNDSWMAAKAISSFLKKKYSGKKYFYITSDYTWGWTTEASLRKFTGTEDKSVHKGILTPFPSIDFTEALTAAARERPDVLVMVLFGQEMANAIRLAHKMGMKDRMQIVVPNLTLGMAERGGPRAMQGVVGTVPWCWQVPYRYHFKRGIQFVEDYRQANTRYPSSSAASAYTILFEYKAAVERAGSFDAPTVIKALEGHRYQLLKDPQVWRDFDHQSVQTVYVVRCKPRDEVVKNKYNLDYFEIIDSLPGDMAACTRREWNKTRDAAGKLARLEKLPGE
ncbi:ABC transporter substrate-binding protein [Desulfosarcina widdelii]|uniref:ABC transporter substrate-binding protein n=1 Tax=Desulfosarcina widdelii TaxID=947919 RepID=A0A5K7Z371_9BACT|nr:substrate-binding protein [Desulfosarcina widdelii]BBO72904.1 ABC transporter substrate-binding protein [Desulfosarcina widdelii]